MNPEFSGAVSKRGVICGGVILALVVTSVMVWSIFDQRDRAIALRKQELVRFGTLVVEVAERAIQAIDFAQRDVVEDIRRKGVTTTADLNAYAAPEAVHLMLQRRIAGLPQVESLTIVDAQGHLLSGSRAWPIAPADLSDREHFQRAQSDPSADMFLTGVVKNRLTGQPTFYIIRRIKAPDGQFLGIVTGAVRLAYFESLYKSILADDHNSVILVLNDGTLVVRYPPTPEFIGRVLTPLAMPKGVMVRAVDAISLTDGQRRFISVHALTNYPASVSVAIDATAALAYWRSDALLRSLVAALLDLAIAGGVILMLRQIRIQRRQAEAARQDAATEARRERDRSALERQAAADRASTLAGLASAFEQQVGQMSRAVADAASRVQSGAIAVTSLAADATSLTQDAAAEATAAAADVNVMAEATEALTGSIEAVARESKRGAALVSAAAQAAHDADATVATLTASASHIGQIVNLISGIAQQTNLLALNATIEAARAGEAGRGFAVVAAEVKTLSKAVSQATEDIRRQIDGMQRATSQTAEAMQHIRDYVTTSNAIASDITRAMENQRTATLQIAGTMILAADGAKALSEHIGDASRAVTQTGATAADVQAVAQLLAGQSDALRAASERFLVQVHAA